PGRVSSRSTEYQCGQYENSESRVEAAFSMLRRHHPIKARRILAGVAICESEWIRGRQHRADLDPGVRVHRIAVCLDQNGLQNRAAFGDPELKCAGRSEPHAADLRRN